VGGLFRSLWSPRSAFAQVEDVPRYGWPLAILLTAVTLIGYATVQSGLIDRAVDLRVQANIAAIDEAQRDVVERSALRALYEREREKGEFERAILRILAVGAEPVALLATILLIAAVLFAAVAITGRKAEWHTLLTIVVYAAAVDVVARLVRFAFMLRFESLDVDTSPGPLVLHLLRDASAAPQAVAALSGLATMLDPFRIWFWIVVVTGLAVTRQLRGWRGWTWCAACWLTGGLVRAAMAAASVGTSAGA
jgi:hypothetical protein